MISLVNKTFFITGLGSGIGLATGQLLTSYGAQVAGTILDKTQAAATAEFCDHSYVLDVTDTASLAAAVQDVTTKSGNLDGVIGGAGIIELKTSSDTSSQQWHKMIDVNLSANFELA